MEFQVGSKIFLPASRNSLSSFDIAFILIPKAHEPITSVVYFAATSRKSTGSRCAASSSRYFSKWWPHSRIRLNISFNFFDVNIGDSFDLNGRHLFGSRLKRCCDNGSTCEQNLSCNWNFQFFLYNQSFLRNRYIYILICTTCFYSDCDQISTFSWTLNPRSANFEKSLINTSLINSGSFRNRIGFRPTYNPTIGSFVYVS